MNLLMMAFLSSGMPATSVYLVKPLFNASMAASLMCSGVSKSGSPALKLMMSSPAARNWAARAETARVADGLMLATR